MANFRRRRKSLPHRLVEFPKELTCIVQDEEDFTNFLLNLLDVGYLTWACTDQRIVRLARNKKIPLHSKQPWKEWRGVLLPVIRKWWEEYTGYNEPKSRQGTFYDRCNELIRRVLLRLPKDTAGQPLYHNKPLTRYRLVELMLEENDSPSIEVCDKYARLWFIRRKCATPQFLTYSDLLFLKRHDPTVHIKGDPRRILPLLRRS